MAAEQCAKKAMDGGGVLRHHGAHEKIAVDAAQRRMHRVLDARSLVVAPGLIPVSAYKGRLEAAASEAIANIASASIHTSW